jgi:hypothetical protein
MKHQWVTRVMRVGLPIAGAALAAGAIVPAARAQNGPTPAEMVAAQRKAMEPLAGFNGIWRGEGWTEDDGKRTTATVTQRVGPFLDGVTQMIETRSYAPDGASVFHAFNNVMWDTRKSAYVMQARAGGLFGNFPLRIIPNGYVWDLGFGTSGLRYTGTIENGVWTEISERISADKPPQKFAEFKLRRVSDSAWPEAGALAAK